MSAVLGPLPLDQPPKSKPVTPMFSCLGEPCGLPATAFTVSSRYRSNARWPTRIPAARAWQRGRQQRGRQQRGRQQRPRIPGAIDGPAAGSL